MASLAVLAVLPTQAGAVPHTAGSWLCTFTEEFRCDAGRQCSPNDSGTRITLYEEGNLYLNCAPGSCIPGAASFHAQGEFLAVHVPEFGSVINLSPDLAVTEVGMIGDVVFFRRGRCAEGPPPAPDRPNRPAEAKRAG